ncbi:MAG: hypothetical protein ABSG41_07580 [Bryobacteraceae bacterium]|jgi:hypothetical protein
MKPKMERGRGLLKNGSGKRGNLSPAMVATINLPSRDTVMLPFNAAFLTHSNTTRIPLLHDVVKAGVIIRKLLSEVIDGAFLRFAENVVSALYVAHVKTLCCLFYVM